MPILIIWRVDNDEAGGYGWAGPSFMSRAAAEQWLRESPYGRDGEVSIREVRVYHDAESALQYADVHPSQL